VNQLQCFHLAANGGSINSLESALLQKNCIRDFWKLQSELVNSWCGNLHDKVCIRFTLDSQTYPLQSPGLRATSYPGSSSAKHSQPQRGCVDRVHVACATKDCHGSGAVERAQLPAGSTLRLMADARFQISKPPRLLPRIIGRQNPGRPA